MPGTEWAIYKCPVFSSLIRTIYVEQSRGGLEPRGAGFSRGLCPAHQLSLLTGSFCFLSQVTLDLFGGPRPVSVGPAWMMLAAGQSVLVVARGIQWGQTRGYLTIPTPSVKEQPPSNVWFQVPFSRAGCRFSHVII